MLVLWLFGAFDGGVAPADGLLVPVFICGKSVYANVYFPGAVYRYAVSRVGGLGMDSLGQFRLLFGEVHV